MTRPTSDERWADATRQPDERRVLDPSERAEVRHFNGEYIVTAGDGRIGPMSYDEAWRSKFLHDHFNGHDVAPDRRDPNAVPNPTRLEVVRS